MEGSCPTQGTSAVIEKQVGNCVSNHQCQCFQCAVCREHIYVEQTCSSCFLVVFCEMTPGLLYLCPLKRERERVKTKKLSRGEKNICSQWINNERKRGACIHLQSIKCRRFHRVLIQGFCGIIYPTAGCYNMQPNIAALGEETLKMHCTCSKWNGKHSISLFIVKALVLNPNVKRVWELSVVETRFRLRKRMIAIHIFRRKQIHRPIVSFIS